MIERICLICNKKFLANPYRIQIGYAKFCSHKCYKISLRKIDQAECEFCKKVFSSTPARIKKRKYCSCKCVTNSQIGKIRFLHTQETKEKIRNALKGRKFSNEHKIKIGDANKRRKCSDETKEKIRNALLGHKQTEDTKKLKAIMAKDRKHSDETKLKMSKDKKGIKNPCWRGGRSKDSMYYRNKRRALIKKAEGTFTIKEWNILKAQNDFKCLDCGKQEPGIKLCADHIIPLSRGGSNYINNIQPLCKPCNSKKHIKTIIFHPEHNEESYG